MTETEQAKPSFVDRYLSVMDAIAEAELKNMASKLDATLTQIVAEKEAEVTRNLQAAFGNSKQNIALNKADLARFGRKIALENMETGKKTPAAVEKAGPEGNVPVNPIDVKLKEYGLKT